MSLAVVSPPSRILAINGGSSSIKLALYDVGPPMQPYLRGKVDRVGESGMKLTVTESSEVAQVAGSVELSDHASAATSLVVWLEARGLMSSIVAVGHRLVFGLEHVQPELLNDALTDDLRRICPNDSEHLPRELELIDALRQRRPTLPQVACFDAAFHRSMPRVATLLPIPRRYAAKGVRRYGFHGLSYAYLMDELKRLGDPAATKGRVVLAHLGSGSSLAAVRDGASVDTSMGFTPTSGLPMSTRSGDLDPGLLFYLSRTEHLSLAALDHMVNHESGLMGVSETSSDMQELLRCEATDARAGDAVAMFCYQTKKCIGAFAAALGGLDTLVFSGGIGENAPAVRARVCEGLEFLGVTLDDPLNLANRDTISGSDSRVSIRVVRTDEEQMIARIVSDVLKLA